MGGIFGSKPKPPTIATQTPKFSDTETTKEVGAPLTAIYGRAHVFGNIFFRQLSDDKTKIKQGVTLCWGPVLIDTHSIRVNEKLPNYVNGVWNPAIVDYTTLPTWTYGEYANIVPNTYRNYGGATWRRNQVIENSIGDEALRYIPPPLAPLYWSLYESGEYIPDTWVWTHDGQLGQSPAHGLDYGLNRTAYLWVEATANDKLTSISKVECEVERGRLFVAGSGYNTPIPAVVSSAFPSGIRSSNPIAAALDWTLNKDYGAGRDTSTLTSFSTFTTAINHCNGILTYQDGGVEHRWSFNYEAGKTEGATHADTIEEILQVGFAKFYESNGVLQCWIARPATPLSTPLDISNFIPNGASTNDITDIPNMVEIEYTQLHDGEKRKVVWEDPVRIADWKEVMDSYQFHGIGTRTQAARAARLIGRRALAERLTLEGEAEQQFMRVEPGDVLPVTVGTADAKWFEGRLFRVEEIVPDNKDHDVDLTLVDYGDDSLYDDGMANVLETGDPLGNRDGNTTLPDPGSPPQGPLNVTALASSVERRPTRMFFVDLDWDLPPQPIYMHSDFVIHRREKLTDPWQVIGSIAGSASSYRDLSADPVNTAYYYWVASRTSANRLSPVPQSGFDVLVPALILDKPPQPQGIVVTVRADSRREITWAYPIVPGDLDGFVVTANKGTVYEPSNAVALHDGILTATKCTTLTIGEQGDWIIAVRAKDTFGNYSDPAIAQYTVAAPTNPDRFLIAQFQGAYRLEVAWDGTKPVNFGGIMVRINQNGDLDWASASALFGGSAVNSTVIPIPVLPKGALAILGRAVDTFGNVADDIMTIYLESQGPILSNVIDAIDHRASGFPGTKTNGTIVSGDLVATSGTLMFAANEELSLYTTDAALMYAGTYDQMVYETTFVAPLAGTIYLDHTITGAFTIELIKSAVFNMYELDGDLMYPNSADPMYQGAPATYEAWPGYAEAQQNETYGFRITTQGGPVAGTIEELVIKIDVPDLDETVEDIVVPIGGTRVPLTKNFTSIKGASITLQYQVGSTAITTMLVDKDVGLGPLIQCFDKDRNAVAGLVDVTVKGY